MPPENFLTGSAIMRPRARLIGLIGEELISDEPVALVELVKNAYDADARNVKISFEGQDPEKPNRIVVIDDGHGMDIDTVLSAWFEPGTIKKRAQNTSPGGRTYLGAKGIGRFAAGRLAETFVLESATGNGEQSVFVLIDWGKFSDESYLDEVSIDYEVRPLPDLKRGTRLTLEGVRKEWSEKDYEELYARLSRLISPFKDVAGFSIFLDIPILPQFSGKVQPPELILKPKYSLNGTVNEEGCFLGSVVISSDIKADPNEKELIPKTIERKLVDADARPNCGPFQLEIRAWDRDRPGLEPFMNKYSMSITEIRRTLDHYCGVSIYRDGFRVYPYGQKGNDWLNLDLRSRLNPPKNLANNQIVAAIRISREDNPGLRDRSTREGMVFNAAHLDLEKWFIEVLSTLEEERYDVRPRREKLAVDEPLFEQFDLSAMVQNAKKEFGKDSPVTKLIIDANKQIQAGVERIQDAFSRLLMAAGIGHLVDIVIHEIGAPLGKINRQLVIIENKLSLALDAKEFELALSLISPIKGWLELIYNLRKRLDPQTAGKRGRATTFDVKEEIEDNFHLYEGLINRQNIKYEIKAPSRPFKVIMSRSSLGQILVNLIDNSVFWIRRQKGAGKGGRIKVLLEPVDQGFSIIFSDDGPSIPLQNRIKIFEPYYTTKPNGMGLGLYIARLLIEPYGKIVYRDDCDLAGACFELLFERRVGR